MRGVMPLHKAVVSAEVRQRIYCPSKLGVVFYRASKSVRIQTNGRSPVSVLSFTNTVRPVTKFVCPVQLKALAKKATKVEKMKNKKAGDRIWTDIEELAALVRR